MTGKKPFTATLNLTNMHSTKTQSCLFAFAFLLLLGCNSASRASKTKKEPGLEDFASALSGQFSSKQQAEADTSYLNISLSMSRIWEDRTDGIWLYVEQALASRREKPYRQRVYQLAHPSKNVFSSEIFTIGNAQEVVGLQDNPARRSLLTFDKIQLKEGCTVLMKHKDGSYEGGTQGANCPSDLRGAKYTTTRIKLSAGRLESWDQGFDAAGKQVWGATKGGYVFIRE